ncbi:MAG: hypothetical protein ACI8QS_000107 [Planctomycetota bacterium]|jgi:hypothetical protein
MGQVGDLVLLITDVLETGPDRLYVSKVPTGCPAVALSTFVKFGQSPLNRPQKEGRANALRPFPGQVQGVRDRPRFASPVLRHFRNVSTGTDEHWGVAALPKGDQLAHAQGGSMICTAIEIHLPLNRNRLRQGRTITSAAQGSSRCLKSA